MLSCNSSLRECLDDFQGSPYLLLDFEQNILGASLDNLEFALGEVAGAFWDGGQVAGWFVSVVDGKRYSFGMESSRRFKAIAAILFIVLSHVALSQRLGT